MNTSISRNELKIELGAGTVKEITDVRKALGHREWQNTYLSETDAAEVREYYRLVREMMVAPTDALLEIAAVRNGCSEQCGEIDGEAIDHSSHRDGEEEVSGMLGAISGLTRQVSSSLAGAAKVSAKQAADSYCIFFSEYLADELGQRASAFAANFNEQITERVRSAPLDLRGASRPLLGGENAEKKQPKRLGLFGG